jgi:predicted N-acetyltransferase YhbS
MSATIRPLTSADLPEAQRIVRRAFGTFLGAPDLDTFWTDFDYVYGRFSAEHVASFGAQLDGELVGSNFATRWGSVGFFGPLSTRSDLWNRGIAQPLVKAVSDAFDEWGVSHAGLCTFPPSTKHAWLYQKFGFYPRYLAPIMAVPVHTAIAALDDPGSRYSAMPPSQRPEVETAVRGLCEELFPGLDLSSEIHTCTMRNLGDTLLLWDGTSRLAGFAICHWGPASEGRSRLPVRQVRRRAAGCWRRRPLCLSARRLRRDGTVGRHGKCSCWCQRLARRGLPADAGPRLSQPDERRHDAPAERARLQSAGPLCP